MAYTRWTTFGWTVALALGVAVALIAFALGMPGDVTFVPVALVAGLLAGLATGADAIGLAGVVGGCLAGVIWLGLTGLAYGGLLWLVFLILAVLLAHGYTVGWIVHRVRRRGIGRHLLDDGALIALAIVVLALPFLYVAVAAEFARNPP